MDNEDVVKMISKEVQKHFRTFGGEAGRTRFNNPIAAALADEPLMFAAGVPVMDVVAFVVEVDDT